MRILIFLIVIATGLSIGSCGRPSSGARAVAADERITDLILLITLTCPTQGVDTSIIERYVGSPSSLHTGTVAVFVTREGIPVRLIDDVRSFPSITKNTGGAYVFNFSYQLENPTVLIGQNVAKLQSVIAVGTRYGGILEALGVAPHAATISHLTLIVNGREVISSDVSKSVRGAGTRFDDVDVAQSFQAIGGS